MSPLLLKRVVWWQEKFEAIVASLSHDAHFRMNLKRPDQLRLLNLWIWSRRYHVSPAWVVKTLLGYWKGVYKREGPLGVRLAVLTGKTSREILQKQVERAYPNQENLKSWKSDQRLAYNRFALVDKFQALAAKNPAQYLADYQEAVIAMRENKRKPTRPYRDSPWK